MNDSNVKLDGVTDRQFLYKRERKRNWIGLLTTGLSLTFLEAYEPIGGLFAEVTNDTLELSVTDWIWAIILDFVLDVVELLYRYYGALADFIESNLVAHMIRNMYILKQASWCIFACETSLKTYEKMSLWNLLFGSSENDDDI